MLIITDIDGTLFNNEHRAEHIPQDKSHTDNWRKFNSLHIYDQPIRYRIQFLQLLAMMPGVEVVYLTGRSCEFYEETKAALRLAGCPVGRLFMRQEGDHRSGAEVKLSLIGDIVGDKHFAHVDDDLAACHAIAAAFHNAHIIKVPSQDCAYLANARELELMA